MATFHLPEEVMMLVQDFLHSRTRKDWRTCKESEARQIGNHMEEVRFLHKFKIELLYEDGWAAHCILRELNSWTLHGLRQIINEPRGWIERIQDEIPDPLLPEWYLHKYHWLVCGDPRWNWIDGEWILEGFD
jgi:hypothetical protein